MHPDRTVLALLHCVVRAVLLDTRQGRTGDPYLALVRAVYPYAVFGGARPPPDGEALQAACDTICRLDDGGTGLVSCYSASMVVQLLAMAHGLSSEMLIGVRKQDQRLSGHAWVEVRLRNGICCINPGRLELSRYRILRRRAPEAELLQWMKARCAAGSPC